MTYSLLNEELNKPRILQKTQDIDEFGKGSNKNSTPRFLSLEFLRVICQKAGRVKLWCGTPFTLPKTNIAPENGPSQKETSIPTIHFQVLC